MAALWQNAQFRFYSVLAACLLLIYLPHVGRYFRMLATMVHEGGHVVVALLLGDRPKRVEIFSDTSGVALVETTANWKALLVSMSGYLFTPCIAFVAYWLLCHGLSELLLWSAVVTAALFLCFYIRNMFGIVWTLCFLLLHLLVLCRAAPFWQELLPHLDAAVLFVDAVVSCLVLLRVAVRCPAKSGDAANIARIAHVPPPLTALGFTAFSVYMDYLSVLHFFPKI